MPQPGRCCRVFLQDAMGDEGSRNNATVAPALSGCVLAQRGRESGETRAPPVRLGGGRTLPLSHGSEGLRYAGNAEPCPWLVLPLQMSS